MSCCQYSAVPQCACAEPAEANVRMCECEVTAVPMISMNGESVFIKKQPYSGKHINVCGCIMCFEYKFNSVCLSEG